MLGFPFLKSPTKPLFVEDIGSRKFLKIARCSRICQKVEADPEKRGFYSERAHLTWPEHLDDFSESLGHQFCTIKQTTPYKNGKWKTRPNHQRPDFFLFRKNQNREHFTFNTNYLLITSNTKKDKVEERRKKEEKGRARRENFVAKAVVRIYFCPKFAFISRCLTTLLFLSSSFSQCFQKFNSSLKEKSPALPPKKRKKAHNPERDRRSEPLFVNRSKSK